MVKTEIFCFLKTENLTCETHTGTESICNNPTACICAVSFPTHLLPSENQNTNSQLQVSLHTSSCCLQWLHWTCNIRRMTAVVGVRWLWLVRSRCFVILLLLSPPHTFSCCNYHSTSMPNAADVSLLLL